MTNLQVKDFPEELYEQLRAHAVDQQRSISQETIYILRQYLSNPFLTKPYGTLYPAPIQQIDIPNEQARFKQVSTEHRHSILEAIHQMGPLELPAEYSDTAQLIRDMREERTKAILATVAGDEA